jgi:hypothetical protein
LTRSHASAPCTTIGRPSRDATDDPATGRPDRRRLPATGTPPRRVRCRCTTSNRSEPRVRNSRTSTRFFDVDDDRTSGLRRDVAVELLDVGHIADLLAVGSPRSSRITRRPADGGLQLADLRRGRPTVRVVRRRRERAGPAARGPRPGTAVGHPRAGALPFEPSPPPVELADEGHRRVPSRRETSWCRSGRWPAPAARWAARPRAAFDRSDPRPATLPDRRTLRTRRSRLLRACG